jgi:hypothetical protein
MSERERASEEFSTSAELASYVEGNTRNENEELHKHTGKVREHKTEFFNFMAFAYNAILPQMPYDFYETDLGKQLLHNEATKVASQAVREGNISQMKYISGKMSHNTDLSGYHTIQKLLTLLNKDAYIQYLFGHMGNGKTDFAILQAELLSEHFNYKIGTNIKSLKEKDAYLYSYGDMLQFLANGRKVESIDEISRLDIDTGNKLVIFDEASSHATGYAKDAHETQEKLGTLVKKIRKVGGNLIIIGHTGKDVHPDIRRIVNHAVHKTGKKTAKYGKSVSEGKLESEVSFSPLSGIPPTNWNSYDTNEITLWDWSVVPSEELDATAEEIDEKRNQETEKRNIEIAKYYAKGKHPDIDPSDYTDKRGNPKEELTMQMLADYYSLSRGRISQIIEEVAQKAEEIQ